MLTPEDEQKIKQIIQDYLSTFIVSDRYVFQKHLQLFDGKNIHLGLSSGFEYPQKVTKLVFKEGLDITQALPLRSSVKLLNATLRPWVGSNEGAQSLEDASHRGRLRDGRRQDGPGAWLC